MNVEQLVNTYELFMVKLLGWDDFYAVCSLRRCDCDERSIRFLPNFPCLLGFLFSTMLVGAHSLLYLICVGC